MNRGNSVVVRQVNEDLVRSTFIRCRNATKNQMAEFTGLSLMTVCTVLNKMVESGEVNEADSVPSDGGRPSHLYRYNSNWSHAITVFITAAKLEKTLIISVADAFSNIVWQERVSIEKVDSEVFMPFIDAALEKFPKTRAIGIGVPGVVSNGKVIACDFTELNSVDLASIYQKKYGIPVIVENDVNCAVSGYCASLGFNGEELLNSENSESDDDNTTVYLYFPGFMAPGSGIWINGSLYHGMENRAGEIGWLPENVEWNKESLYKDEDAFAKAVSSLIHLFISILAPRRFIISSCFISDSQFLKIQEEYYRNEESWWNGSIHSVNLGSTQKRMELLLSNDFECDYWNGLVRLTQDLLLPKYEIKARAKN